jgi:hypothetical protein
METGFRAGDGGSGIDHGGQIDELEGAPTGSAPWKLYGANAARAVVLLSFMFVRAHRHDDRRVAAAAPHVVDLQLDGPVREHGACHDHDDRVAKIDARLRNRVRDRAPYPRPFGITAYGGAKLGSFDIRDAAVRAPPQIEGRMCDRLRSVGRIAASSHRRSSGAAACSGDKQHRAEAEYIERGHEQPAGVTNR